MSMTTIPTMVVEDVELRAQPCLEPRVDPLSCDHVWEPGENNHAVCRHCRSIARWIDLPLVTRTIPFADASAASAAAVKAPQGSCGEAKIVVLDVESTGKERATDQIIELCLRFGLSLEAESRTWRIRPSVAIHPEATGVHGITAEDVANCPPFSDVALAFLPLLNGAHVIVGYNISFDLDMLQAELSRAKLPPLDLTGKQIVDVLRLWHHIEPRTLVAAHQKFCGTPLVKAHQAAADVAATARVLTAMLETFGLANRSWPEIAAISNPFTNRSAWLGPSSHIQWDESGAVVFGFGKHKGCQVVHADRGFLKWIIAKDFPPHVQNICTVALERNRQFIDWITTIYPRPSPKKPEPAPEDLSEQEAIDVFSAQEALL